MFCANQFLVFPFAAVDISAYAMHGAVDLLRGTVLRPVQFSCRPQGTCAEVAGSLELLR